jgi:asparagine synthase (glutamine-hydrolysing)
MADALEHRGPDGRDELHRGPLSAVHLHAWVTPEERGERQPLERGSEVLLFDGRLDNRRELEELLAADFADGRGMTDAEMALTAHQIWGEAAFERMVGPWALALVDLETGSALLARDPLGDRTLFYSIGEDELRLGSEEVALLAHPGVSARLDESRLAHYFALEVPGDGSTFFRDVREVRAGCVLRFSPGGGPVETTLWAPGVATISARSDQELAEEYLHLLTRAVSCRLRSTRPAAVLMSGGLDSTSVAALAARVASGSTERPRSISWVFSDPDLDERPYIEPVVERCDLAAVYLNGDELGPSVDSRAIALNPNSPEESPYRRLKSAAYTAAVEAGSTALLTGGSADALYTGF